MEQPSIISTNATLGAFVSGVDLAALDDDTWTVIEAAFHRHGVLIFPGQHLNEQAQAAFGRRFGDLEFIRDDIGVLRLSNRRADGTPLASDDPRMLILKGNEGWHTDSSYMPLAAKASMLTAEVVPSAGGETEWADMRAAYDALDDATKVRISQLCAYHSLRHSQARIGDTNDRNRGYGFDVVDPPLRPLVKVHPATGRPSLFIGRHAYGIPGLTPSESETLLNELLQFACQPPRIYQHRWTPGDLVVWDNRCVLHRARPYDQAQTRVMRHTRVSGDPATELATSTV